MFLFSCSDININDLMPSIRKIILMVDDKILTSHLVTNQHIEKYLFWINIAYFNNDNSFLIDNIEVLQKNILEHKLIKEDLKKNQKNYKNNKLQLISLFKKNINSNNLGHNKILKSWILCHMNYKNYEKAIVSEELHVIFKDFFHKACEIFSKLIYSNHLNITNKLNFENSLLIDDLLKEILFVISDFEINYKLISNKYFNDLHNTFFCKVEYEIFQKFIRIFVNLLLSKIYQLSALMSEQRIFIFTTLKYYLSISNFEVSVYSDLLLLLDKIIHIKADHYESFILEFNKNPEEVERENQILIEKLKNIYNNQFKSMDNPELNNMMNILMFVIFLYLKTNEVISKFNKHLYSLIFYIK